MSVLTLAQLTVAETRAAIYARALSIAESLGLPVDSWEPGDPTRSTYHLLAATLSNAEKVISDYIAAGFLDHATGDWLVLLAKQVYDVDGILATTGTCTCRLTNGSGALFVFQPGDITVKNTATSGTFKNTTGGTLSPLGALDLEFESDETGTAKGSAGIGEIDAFVTNYLNVSVSNLTAAIASDAESDDQLRARCRSKLGALSPNGPVGAYEYISLTTRPGSVTRCRVYGDSATGTVRVYVAGNTGGATLADAAAIEAELVKTAAPLCVTPVVIPADSKQVTVTYSLWVYNTIGLDTATVKKNVADKLSKMFAARPISGDDGGKIYRSLIESTIREACGEHAFRVQLTSPSADVVIAENEVAVLYHDTSASTVTQVSK